jgi:hypothetical protein
MKLYVHQQKILKEDPKKTGLFLGTGSGKTLTALLLAREYVVVICPKTQKEDRTWERQAEKIPVEMRRWKEIKVMSKEEFRRDWQDLADRIGTDGAHFTVIVDEAHTCLGATPNVRYVKKVAIPKNSQTFDALQAFIAQVNPGRLYLCTATIIKSPMTVWAAGVVLGKKWNWYEWRNIFYTRLPMPGREIWMPKKDSAIKDRLARLVRSLGYVGRLQDFFDVPAQTWKTIHVELTEKQRQRIVLIGKKHQVENGVLSGNEFSDAEHFENQKLEKLLDMAIEFPRMIVFAKYTAQIEQIATVMKSMGKKVFTLTGATQDRGTVIAEALTCEDYVFICQSQISAGWELPNCPVMVFASKTYSFVDYDQGLGRIQRANNIKKNLYINLVVRDGVDDAIEKCIDNKCDFNERIYAGV